MMEVSGRRGDPGKASPAHGSRETAAQTRGAIPQRPGG
jgi:hypothetical protein